MIEQNVVLEKIEIINFLSLRSVEMPLKRLTVLVGPNASGKSNSLRALELLRKMMNVENPPGIENVKSYIWAGDADSIRFKLYANINENPIYYDIELEAVEEVSITEKLVINEINVISVNHGVGIVRDEDGGHETDYRSTKPKLALKSAGDYGNKPITSILTEYIKDWEFYDFQPDTMRGGNIFSQIFMRNLEKNDSSFLHESPKLNDDGSTLRDLLLYWAINDNERFSSVNQSLENFTKLSIEQSTDGSDYELFLREGYKNPIPLRKCSDGTIRLIAYYSLLNTPNIPPLIAIEEPERNLHPAALQEIAFVLQKLSKRTQVILTTHSSQLLDMFNPNELNDDLGILLLQNIPGQGTKVINLNDVKKQKESLSGWIDDFGIGSAIFDSGLAQE